MAHADAGVAAQLGRGFNRLFGGATLAAFGQKGRDLGVVCFQLFGNRMIGRDAHKGRAHQCVGPRGINSDRIARIGALKGELQAPRFADPVLLHQLDLGRPVVEPVDRIQQLFREIADLEEPLCQLAAFHLGT